MKRGILIFLFAVLAFAGAVQAGMSSPGFSAGSEPIFYEAVAHQDAGIAKVHIHEPGCGHIPSGGNAASGIYGVDLFGYNDVLVQEGSEGIRATEKLGGFILLGASGSPPRCMRCHVIPENTRQVPGPRLYST